jgi:mono/diheme cytochrome c family protein
MPKETIMRPVCRLLVVLASAIALHAQANAADAVRGKALYENHCIGCHEDSVHKREHRKATSREEVAKFVARWEREMNLKWSDEERADVVDYVAARFYKF